MRIKRMNRNLLKEYTSLINRARADWPRNRDWTTEQVESIYYGNPNYDEKSHFLAYVEGKLVGECSGIIDPRTATKAELCAYIDLSILPEYRQKSIGKKLLRKVVEYLRRRGVTEVQADVPATCKGSREFYEKQGFWKDGKTLELTCNLQSDLPDIPLPEGYLIRPPEFPNEKADFLKVWNKANAETEESPPTMTPEAYESFLAFPNIQSLYLIAVREKDNKIVGVLSCFIDPAYNKKNRVKEAQMEITGVLPEERNKGIATAMILEATQWMKTKRITTAIGIINSNNKNIRAVSRKLIAQITNEQLTYKLRI